MNKKFCRLCKSNKLSKFLDLGLHPPSDQFISLDELTKLPINSLVEKRYERLMGYGSI